MSFMCIEQVAEAILKALGSARVIELGELSKRMANDVFTNNEFNKALTHLKTKQKKIQYDTLKKNTDSLRVN